MNNTSLSLTENLRQILREGLSRMFSAYFQHGPRSSKKTDILNELVVNSIECVIRESNAVESGDIEKPIYEIKMECDIPSDNFSKKKRCDVVVFKNGVLFMAFPLKFIMTSYSKNKNNYYENITGEVLHLRWANPDIHIVPINIILDKIPNLAETDKEKRIKNFEIITHENSLNVYHQLVKNNIIDAIYNVVVITEPCCVVGEKYTKMPTIIELNENRPLAEILAPFFV